MTRKQKGNHMALRLIHALVLASDAPGWRRGPLPHARGSSLNLKFWIQFTLPSHISNSMQPALSFTFSGDRWIESDFEELADLQSSASRFSSRITYFYLSLIWVTWIRIQKNASYELNPSFLCGRMRACRCHKWLVLPLRSYSRVWQEARVNVCLAIATQQRVDLAPLQAIPKPTKR